MGQLVAYPNRLQNIAGFEAGAGAGRARADRHIANAHHHRLAFHKGKAQVQVSRKAIGRVAIQADITHLGGDAIIKPFAKGKQSLGFRFA